MIICTGKRKETPSILFRERMVRRTEEMVLALEGRALAEAVEGLHAEVRIAARIALDEADGLRTEMQTSSGKLHVHDATADDVVGTVELAPRRHAAAPTACMQAP